LPLPLPFPFPFSFPFSLSFYLFSLLSPTGFNALPLGYKILYLTARSVSMVCLFTQLFFISVL
jgi:hypothetical protein